ncbi:MAG: HAD-IA family hydrolase [Alphaproteobacteria bacterium]|nr:HAD-IA family hydrolase [Alphaproteobacteria bacterium]
MSDRPLQLVIFDCDGTLVDSQHGIVSAMRTAFAALGVAAPEPSDVRRVVGLPLEHAIARLDVSGDEARHAELTRLYRLSEFEQRAKGEHEEVLFPGITEVIRELEAVGLLLAVATMKSRRGLLATLHQLDLAERFVSLQTADSAAAGKPAPDLALQAMAEAGVMPQHAVVVGDTVYDMEMARAAGAAAVGVGWGYHDALELETAGADAIVHDSAELPATVVELLG